MIKCLCLDWDPWPSRTWRVHVGCSIHDIQAVPYWQPLLPARACLCLCHLSCPCIKNMLTPCHASVLGTPYYHPLLHSMCHPLFSVQACLCLCHLFCPCSSPATPFYHPLLPTQEYHVSSIVFCPSLSVSVSSVLSMQPCYTLLSPIASYPRLACVTHCFLSEPVCVCVRLSWCTCPCCPTNTLPLLPAQPRKCQLHCVRLTIYKLTINCCCW